MSETRPANASPRDVGGFIASWPKSLAALALAVETVLRTLAKTATPEALAKHFLRAQPDDVQEILETLVALGTARAGKAKGSYSA